MTKPTFDYKQRHSQCLENPVERPLAKAGRLIPKHSGLFPKSLKQPKNLQMIIDDTMTQRWPF